MDPPAGHSDSDARAACQDALDASDALLQAVLDTVPEVTIVIDAQGRIRTFSRAAEALFGISAAEATASDIVMLLPSDRRAGGEDILSRCLASGPSASPDQSHRWAARRSDGARLPVDMFLGRAMVRGEQLFVLTIRDISARLAAEERLATLCADLTQVSRLTAMGEIAAGLAQDLNQPLAAASNYLGTARILLGQDGERSEVLELLDLSASQSLRAGDIIRRLREFLRKPQTDQRAEPVEPTVREAAAVAAIGQGQFAVRVDFALDPAADRMFADRIQVQQVLVNLLRNSVAALQSVRDRRREIFVTSRAMDAATLEISVSDTGPGFTAVALAQLDRPFSPTGNGAGPGLGLSISRRIVEANRGELRIANRPAGGACVRFTLPMAAAGMAIPN